MLSKLLRNPKKLLVNAIVYGIVAAHICSAAALEQLDNGLTKIAVEQIQARMPMVEVYLYNREPVYENGDIEAYLDGKQLSYLGTDESGAFGTSYTVMLDVSGSIRPSYFEAAKKQIASLADTLRPGDSITLITFGDDVVLQTRQCRDQNQIQMILDQLDGKDQNTCLYEAIHQGIDYMQADGTDNRQVMLIVSDGFEDTGSAGITRQEVEDQAAQNNVPVYALCVDYVEVEKQEEFGRFARLTGGSLISFGAQDAESEWDNLLSWLNSAARVQFQSDSNKIDGETHTLLIKLKTDQGEENYTREIKFSDWIPDTTAPEIVDFIYLPHENALKIQFSEQVTGADQASGYVIQKGQETLVPFSVSQLDSTTYLVQLPDDVQPGNYTVTFAGIRDDSMEQNTLESDPIQFKKGWTLSMLIPFAGAIVVLALLAAAVIVWKRREKQPQTITYEVHHVQAESVKPIHSAGTGASGSVTIQLTSGEKAGQTLDILIDKSSIWGRSDLMSDVCFQDKRMSRQHCVFTVREDGIWLSDLDSQNGTYLNGIRLVRSQKLGRQDQIRIGDTSFRIVKISWVSQNQQTKA